MADSCRPVSRHGRYNSTGPSSVPYGTDVGSYGNVDYTPSNEMYTVNKPDRPERPKTSRGRRRRAEAPPRPSSRRSRQFRDSGQDADHESFGRPASRVGFSPETSYRYSHDEFSRQASESEKQVVNSPVSSPDEDIYQAPGFYNPTQHDNLGQQDNVGQLDNLGQHLGQHDNLGQHLGQQDNLGQLDNLGQHLGQQDNLSQHLGQQDNLGNQSPGQVDRLIISPSNPQENIYRKSPQNSRQSPQRYSHSPKGYGQSPQHGTQFNRPHSRPSSRDFINVSPIQRDEAQIRNEDLHHDPSQPFPIGGDPYAHEGEAYVQGFGENPHYRNSPNRDSPQFIQPRNSPYRDSPQFSQPRNSPYRDSPQYRDSPYNTAISPTNRYSSYGSPPQTYRRPPPSQRPKSARPKTGRKKSARARYRHEEQETSQPQMCNTDSILHTGDPYGRPSSSLSRYKPLPAIGATTPRSSADQSPYYSTEAPSQPHETSTNTITTQAERLVLDDHDPAMFHPASDNIDSVSAEDVQGAYSQVTGPMTDHGLPDVDILTNFPQHLSNEIVNKSLTNFEQNISGDGDTGRYSAEMSERNEGSHSNVGQNSRALEQLDFLHELPSEPSVGDTRLLLAVKLHDGKRIQRYFSPSDPLKAVVDFAENTSLVKFRDFHLVCNAPRTTFVDLTQLIKDTGLQDRTVLYLEEKEM